MAKRAKATVATKRKTTVEPMELFPCFKRLAEQFPVTSGADGQPQFSRSHLAALTPLERTSLREEAAAAAACASNLVAQIDASAPAPGELRAEQLPDFIWWEIMQRLAYADVLQLASVSNGFRTMVADSGRVTVLSIQISNVPAIRMFRNLASSRIAHLYTRAHTAAFRIITSYVKRPEHAVMFADAVNAVLATMTHLTLLEVGSTSSEIPMDIRRDNPILAPDTVRCVVDDVQGGWLQSATATVYCAGLYVYRYGYSHLESGPGVVHTIPALANVVDSDYMTRCPLVRCVHVPNFQSYNGRDRDVDWCRDSTKTTARWSFPTVTTLQLDANNIDSTLFSNERLASVRTVIVRHESPSVIVTTQHGQDHWKGTIMDVVAKLYARLAKGCMLYIDDAMLSCVLYTPGLPLIRTRPRHMFAKLAAIGGSKIRVCANPRILNRHKDTVWRTPAADGSEDVVYIVGRMNGKVQRIVPFAQYISKEDMDSSPIYYPPV